MAYAHILVDVDDGLGTITMNRPAQRNALSEAHLAELLDAFRRLGDDDQCRAVVLAANGPVFSAGHDFSDMVDRDEVGMRRLLELCAEVMATIQALPLPVVAQVQGLATAAGCQLVATADLAVAAEEAAFAAPGGQGGWFCHTPMVAIARVVSRKRAAEMAFTGDRIDAATALAWGLVNRVVARERLVEETVRLARAASRGSRASKALGKRVMWETCGLDTATAYSRATDAMAASAVTADGREAMAAFLEKRPGVYPTRR
ncbi:MAG TPA: enoyl-CoA hydratase-related protein [Candidatus Binatia bacterium]|jgi:enoyl-CoA hydratase/carnithine racemase|nr:enoyl-CoA hydratase-related protein [Candidatus Binatia bacterium]